MIINPIPSSLLLQPYGWWCKIREWKETKITAFAHILLLYSKENIYMNNNRIQVEMAAIIRDVHCMPVELWLTLELDSEPLIYCIGCVVLLGILAEAWLYDAISSNCHVCRVYGYLTWQLHSLVMTWHTLAMTGSSISHLTLVMLSPI